jgi:hypothetical protein
MLRPAAWLAAFAILLQAVLPLAHHPAGMALAGAAGFNEARNLCLAPGSVPAPADAPDKAPAHHLPACALCQAVHAIGGFAPPTATPVLIARRNGAVAYAAAWTAPGAQRRVRASQQPRAPPILV